MAGRGAVGGVGLYKAPPHVVTLRFPKTWWYCDSVTSYIVPGFWSKNPKISRQKLRAFYNAVSVVTQNYFCGTVVATSLCQHEPDSKRRDYSKAQIPGVMGNCEGIFED